MSRIHSTIDVVLFFPSTAKLHTETEKKGEKRKKSSWNKSKKKLFKKEQLHWIHVDHNQLDLCYHLKSYIYTNILLVLKSQKACATTKTENIVV